MILVADACPVIFLAKLNRLALISAVDELIRDHAMRISVDLYQETMRQLR